MKSVGGGDTGRYAASRNVATSPASFQVLQQSTQGLGIRLEYIKIKPVSSPF